MTTSATPAPDASVLFCSSCIFFQAGACAAGKVAEGEDITTVSDCIHREPITPAGETPAQEN